MRKTIICIMAASLLVGCAATTFINQDQSVKSKLLQLAENYDEVREKLIAINETGAIDPVTWQYLQDVDMFFDEVISEAYINVNDVHDPTSDWRISVSKIVDILQIAAPVIDLVSGVLVCTPIASAIRIGHDMLGKYQTRAYDLEHAIRIQDFKERAIEVERQFLFQGDF